MNISVMVKTFLILAVLVVGAGALALGGVGWFLVASLTGHPSSEAATAASLSQEDASAGGKHTPEGAAEGAATTTGVLVSVSQFLSPQQQALVERVGIDLSQLSVTPQMVACAQQALGEKRLMALQDGALPTFAEMGSLLGCLEGR